LNAPYRNPALFEPPAQAPFAMRCLCGKVHEGRCPDGVPQAAGARRKLWEVHPKHHCVLIGAAFDPRELRRMFLRSEFEINECAGDYELHSSAVHYAGNPNAVSRLAHRLLDERYRGAINRCRNADCAERLVFLWREAAAHGDPIAMYWAALTHPLCDGITDELLSREMHMHAHDTFASRRAAQRQVAALGGALAQAERSRKRIAAQCEALRREAARLREETLGAQRAARLALEAQRGALAQLERWTQGEAARAREAQFAALAGERDAACEAAAEAQRDLRRARQRIAWLEQAGPEAQAAARAAQPASRAASAAPGHAPPQDLATAGTAAPADLRSRRVLCVGGKTSLVPMYRATIEAARGDFAYHDGGIEDHVGRLPAQLAACDAVVCLASDVSHSAYHLVKRYCKKTGKPCALLGNASLHAFSAGLQRLAPPQAQAKQLNVPENAGGIANLTFI